MTTAPKLYAEFAKYYDQLEGQYRNHDADCRWILKQLSEFHSKRVLDISCGTGNHISRLSSQAKGIDFHAMDLSKEMVLLAFQRTRDCQIDFLRADFLKLPIRKQSVDSVLCLYWSLAGLDEQLVFELFCEIEAILQPGGLFLFDVENSEGIKENLLDEPFIDAFFQVNDEDLAVIRANLSRKTEKDVVDWRAYYLIEKGGVSELFEDRMKLRFYSRSQLERCLDKSGFDTISVGSGPLEGYEQHSPSLFFSARKRSA